MCIIYYWLHGSLIAWLNCPRTLEWIILSNTCRKRYSAISRPNAQLSTTNRGLQQDRKCGEWPSASFSRCGAGSLFVFRYALTVLPAQIPFPISNNPHGLLMMCLDFRVCTPKWMLGFFLCGHLCAIGTSQFKRTKQTKPQRPRTRAASKRRNFLAGT